MNKSNAVFVIGGVIGIIFGVSVSVLSFPLLLRAVAPEIAETPAQMQKPPSRVSEAVNTDGSDIIKELETDFPSQKAIRVQSAYTPGPERSIATPELAHAEAPAPVGPKIVIEADARPQPLREELSGKLRKAGLADIDSAKPSPPASTNAALAPAQVTKDPVTEQVAVNVPELPVRHPLRQAIYEHPPLVTEVQFAPASAAPQPAGPFLASLPQNRNPADAAGPAPGKVSPNAASSAQQPAGPFLASLRQNRNPADAAGPAPGLASPGAASSALVSQSPVTSTQEGYAPGTKWTPELV